MDFTSTRDSLVKISGSQAIVSGLSKDGGLYVPQSFPKLDMDSFEVLYNMSYQERAAHIMSLFMDEFTYEELLEYAEKAYSRFDGDPAPIVNFDEGVYLMELWHGPTHAFKDIALTMLPYLISASKNKCGIKDKTLILVATSGDTGKAALEGFKDVDNTNIMVFYPSEGVSEMQKLQMATQEGGNVFVGAINGNFDDAQTAVKHIFNDLSIERELYNRGFSLSSANSINWGRLMPQIVYYISSYCDLVTGGEIEQGDKVNFCVPTGNFGNILAGYYAHLMGLPINKLICASNSNNVLTEFFLTGKYDINRDFIKTMSPSMDILISSNLERLLYELVDRDSDKLCALMQSLKSDNQFDLPIELIQEKADVFDVGYASEEETELTIENFYETFDYVIDPHTAVAMHAYNSYVSRTGDFTNTIVLSTASPYKFAKDVYHAIAKREIQDPFKACQHLNSFSLEPIPDNILELQDKDINYSEVYENNKLADVVLDYALKNS